MRRAPGSSIAGFVPSANDILLSQHFQKKTITVNHDFAGYRYATVPGGDASLSPLQKNNIFYRETTSPGKYAALLLVVVNAYNASPYIDVLNADKNKLGSGSGALLHWFDNSAAAWATGAQDSTRYVTVVGADDSGGAGYARLTISGAPSLTPQDTADAVCAAVDSGIRNMIDYVVVDQEIDFRATAKPSAISADFAIDAIYVGRLNQRFLNGYSTFPSAFIGALKAANQRLILDNPQI